MSSILSMYLDTWHDWPSTWDYMRRLQPAWVRIHQVGPRDLWMTQQTAPNANILLRSWDIDDHNGDRKQEMYANPKRAAALHLAMWSSRLAGIRSAAATNGWKLDESRWHIGLINEPDPNHLPELVEYTAEAMRLTDRRLGILFPSVGNFGKPGEPNPWGLIEPLLSAILDGGHIVVIHEYWQPEGPSYTWTDNQGNMRVDDYNLAWRHKWIPFDVPLLIGESGANGFIFNRHSSKDDAGWGRFMEPAEYARQVQTYIAGCDTRVQGVCLFMTDYHSDQWASFDTTPAHEQLLAIKDTRPTVRKPAPSVYIPVVVVGQPVAPGVPLTPNGIINTPDVPPSLVPDETPPAPPSGVLDPNVLMAILDVESGVAFGPGGRLLIRFETHVFKTQLGNDELFQRHFAIADSKPWAQPQAYRAQADGPWVQVHGSGQASEWAAFETAARLDRNAALRSISMGRPQIIGFNHARIGYPTAEAMFAAFGRRQDGEAAQIVGMLNYMLTAPALVQAVKEHDWRTIARLYNGAGAVDVYAPLLEAAWRKRAGV